jgi:RimJ/RimL family protein N-acetyltransferase
MLDRLYVPLSDGDLALVKLAEAHREGLRAACAKDDAVWQVYSSSFDPDHFDISFAGLIGHPSRMPYAIVHLGTVVGMTAWLRADVSAQTVEIGNSFIAPALRSTGFNRRLKTLMLNHGFAVGIRRVEFRIDERNGRSQAAARKIGAVKEGVLRAERVTWTGHVRDTGLFSIDMIMTRFIATLIIAALPFSLARAEPQLEPAPREVGKEASVSFPAHGGIRNFRADNDRGVWIEDRRRNWYYASFIGNCPGIRFAQAIGFDTRGSAHFDRYTKIIVEDDVCAIETLVTADKPLPLRDQRRFAKEAKEAIKAEGAN